MRSQIKSIATLAVGVSLFGATGYFLYLLFRKDSDDDYSETIPITCMQTKLEMKIPRESVRCVIGRNGSHIREIELKSQTRIIFKEQQPDEKFRVCVIRGASKNCGLAESLIHEMLAYQPVIETKELWVPCVSIARIIGRCGERISNISQLSGAKIHVSDADSLDATEKRILIKGTNDQIELAKSYIVDIVREDAEIRKKIETKLAQREPRGKQKLDPNLDQIAKRRSSEKLSSDGGGDGQIEVYVSAVTDPSQFHLQIVGPKANELDLLVEEMTEYYTNPENRYLHIIDHPKLGEIVAGLFQHDNKWYRAEIIDLKLDADPKLAELFFLDYGDTEEVVLDQVLELRTDFLRLRFQAIECYLAKIRPNGTLWSEEAVDKFCELTQVAQWKKLRAKISGYKDRNIKNISEAGSGRRFKREGSPIPGVDLYAISAEEDLDIGMEMVRQGFAELEENPKMSSSTTSIGSHSSKAESDSHFVNDYCLICHGNVGAVASRSSTYVSTSCASILP